MPQKLNNIGRGHSKISNTHLWKEENNSKNKNEFYGVFMPSIVLKMKRLTPNEKIILAFIIAFTRGKRFFFGSNDFLENSLGISKGTVSKSIKNLKVKGFIIEGKFNGRNRKLYPTEKLKSIREECDKLKSSTLNNATQGYDY